MLFLIHVNTFFSIDRSRVQLPEAIQESSIEDPTHSTHAHALPALPVTYEIVQDGTQRRREKLVDSLGYTYNVKERGKVTTYWQCTVRPKGNYCRATVKQTGENFVPGASGHNHPAEAGALIATKISASVKRKAVDELFRPASAIVEEVQ